MQTIEIAITAITIIIVIAVALTISEIAYNNNRKWGENYE